MKEMSFVLHNYARGLIPRIKNSGATSAKDRNLVYVGYSFRFGYDYFRNCHWL